MDEREKNETTNPFFFNSIPPIRFNARIFPTKLIKSLSLSLSLSLTFVNERFQQRSILSVY